MDEGAARGPAMKTERDEFSCPCCGTPTDSSYCSPCVDAGCGERDFDDPNIETCLAEESKRLAENERKAKLYDAAISSLRNALADFEAKWKARDDAGTVYFAMPVDFHSTHTAEYKAASETYETASMRVRDEAFRVVGTVEAIVGRDGR
jgi:hypothetical protein